MLRSLRRIIRDSIAARDGEIGGVEDFYFDDHAWSVRYLVVDTGRWLPGRLVLLAPAEIESIDWEQEKLGVKLAKEQIEKAPNAHTELPVSRQHEHELVRYYGWVPYWAPMGGAPAPMPVDDERKPTDAEHQKRHDPNLRSAKEVIGYHIRASDGDIGHVEDFMVETDEWIIRYMAIDTRNWLGGRKVLVSPDWIHGMDWINGQVRVDLTRDQIKNSPEYDPDQPVNRQYEQALYDYYGRRHYWP